MESAVVSVISVAHTQKDPSVPAPGQDLRCTHCGRRVHPTVHTRDGWKVDHYLLWTGPVEPAVFRREDDGIGIEYLRLLRPELVVTCTDCLRLPEVEAGRRFPEEEDG